MSDTCLSVLIPAAGASRRLGQPKQLLQHKGQSLLQNAVNLADSVAPRQIIVVTGAHAETVENAVQHASVQWVHNPDWPDGMGVSIALGSAAINPDARALMILLCDQWCIGKKDLEVLVNKWRSAPDRIVIAEVEGRYMPPVIFPSTFFSELRDLQSDQGARHIIAAHPDLISPVSMANAAFDMDTPAQLETLPASTLIK